MARVKILVGDCRQTLRTLEDSSVHTVITSPPYYGLRDYGADGQIGAEPTIEEYIETLVTVFGEARRILHPRGTLWLNMGDSYHTGAVQGVLKPKDLMGIPWRLALALQADGWWLRQDIVWAKPNPLPEPTRDRCTKAHEYLFLLSPSRHYYFDWFAIQEPTKTRKRRSFRSKRYTAQKGLVDNTKHDGGEFKGVYDVTRRRKRSVWTVTTESYKGSHFATFPTKLIVPCVLAGTSHYGVCAGCAAPWERIIQTKVATPRQNPGYTHDVGVRGDGDRPGYYMDGFSVSEGWQPTCDCDRDDVVPAVVLDPFGGAGTAALVAANHERDSILCELNPQYATLSANRLRDKCGALITIEIIEQLGENKDEKQT